MRFCCVDEAIPPCYAVPPTAAPWSDGPLVVSRDLVQAMWMIAQMRSSQVEPPFSFPPRFFSWIIVL